MSPAKSIKFDLLLISIAVIARLIPHLPNATPIIPLCLLAGKELSSLRAISILVLALFISDALLASWQHFSMIGSWSFYTYSGFIAIIALSRNFLNKISLPSFMLCAIASGIGFWLWTNFGTWLSSGIYSHTLNGLITCYIAALPFLHNELFGDCVWSAVVFYSFYRQPTLVKAYIFE